MAHLFSIVDHLNRKGASLRVLNLSIDTSTPTGKLMLTMLGGIAQFEREIMLERQREGIAKAKAEGKYRGRTPTARAKEAEVMRLKTGASGRPRSPGGSTSEGRASTVCSPLKRWPIG